MNTETNVEPQDPEITLGDLLGGALKQLDELAATVKAQGEALDKLTAERRADLYRRR